MDHFRSLAIQCIYDGLKYTAVQVCGPNDDDFVHYITSRLQKEGPVQANADKEASKMNKNG